MNKIIFHIGYPRTGSTYLQTKIFPKISNLNFLGKSFNKKNSKIFYEFEKKIFNYDEIFFQKNKNYLAKQIKTLFNKKINLLSHEGFLRNTRFFEKKNKFYKGNNYSTNLRRIYQVLNLLTTRKNIFYLIFVRKQQDILPSYYSNFWESEFETSKNINFSKFVEDCVNPKKYNFGKIINYNDLFNFLSSFMPKKNIIFINHESFFLKENIPLKQFSSLLETNEIKVNKLITEKLINSNKKDKYFYYKNMNNFLPKFIKKNFFHNAKLQKKIYDFYRVGNKDLDKKIKTLKLKSKNYY